MKKLGLLVVPFLLVGLVGCGKGEAKEVETVENGDVLIGQYVDLEGNESKRGVSKDMILYPKNHKFVEVSTRANYLIEADKYIFEKDDYDYDFKSNNGSASKMIGFDLFMSQNNYPFKYLIIKKEDKINKNKEAVEAVGKFNLAMEKTAKKYYTANEYFDFEPLDMISIIDIAYDSAYNESTEEIIYQNANWIFAKYITGYYEKSIAYNELIHTLRDSVEGQKFSNDLEEEINYFRKDLNINRCPTNDLISDSFISLDAKVKEADELFSEEIAKAELEGLASVNMELMKIPQDIYPIEAE